MNGLLVATGAQAATRMSVIAKSPMAFPEGYSFGNIGGHFPAELKEAGIDGIVMDGKGSTLDKEKYTDMLKEYYRLRGWDEETGLPLPETLNNMGLHDVASEFKT